MRQTRTPIYCGRCGKLALANLNSEPLCPHCLINSVRQSSDQSVLGQISPLSIATATIGSLVKCRPDTYTSNRAPQTAISGSSSYKY